MRLITTILTSAILLLLSSCNKPNKSDVSLTQKIVVDGHGYKYRLFSTEKILSDGFIQPELWERIDPPETNRWYTPTLGSKYNTNEPPMFNSLMR